MPAGNDSQAAARELADAFGGGTGKAEELIQASRKRYSGDLAAAQLAERDAAASAELDLDAVAKTAGLKKGQVLDASVRGQYVLFLAESADAGRTFKGAFPKEDVGKAAKSESKKSDSD